MAGIIVPEAAAIVRDRDHPHLLTRRRVDRRRVALRAAPLAGRRADGQQSIAVLPVRRAEPLTGHDDPRRIHGSAAKSRVGIGRQAGIDRVIQGVPLHLRQDQGSPAEAIARPGRVRDRDGARREQIIGIHVIVDRQADLLQVVGALGPPRRFACGLHRRQEQGDQDCDDRDHHQQLDERESGPRGFPHVVPPIGHDVE